jgi:serine/threonine-protein kinase
MGRVFEGHDLKHRRAVAIKVLDPEVGAAIGSKRFRAEIETAARLSHPHIVPLFDSGQAGGLFYFVMPLVTGESLRQRLLRERQLPIDEAVRFAREAADALRYAHEQGLIHRDVKPENILISGGHALIFDFGIARSGGDESAPTRTLVPIGTPAYMSPEQIAGAPLDSRTDEYALACVLYEMLAGQPPFTGPSSDNVLSQHRTAEARPIAMLRASTPANIAAALTRALSKAPADRYRSLSEFADAISTLGAMAQVPQKDRVMLAVLPLDNLSADPEQEYFTEGMTEELIAHLGRVQPKRLGVIARTSAMRYKKTQKSIGEIGAELGVEFVLEGSVRRAGDRIRITTQLVQVSDQSHLWAETYDRRMADVFELQDEVASTVAKALELELVPVAGGREPVMGTAAAGKPALSGGAPGTPPPGSAGADSGVTNNTAYEAYLKGRFYWNKRTAEGMRQGVEWFKRAIAADPNFAPAHSGLSDVYNITLTYMVLPGEEAMRESEKAARRALELDPNLADAHTSLASVLGHLGHTAKAVESLQHALELNPNYVPALYWGSVVLATRGDFAGGFALLERARVLDPVSVTVNITCGNLYFLAGREEEALRFFQEAVGLEPQVMWPLERIATCRVALGRAEEALAGLNKAPPEAAKSHEVISARSYVLGKLGRKDEARALLRELEARAKTEYVSWERFANAYLGLDDIDALASLLGNVKIFGSLGRLRLRHEAAFAPVRSDPRLAKVFQRVSMNEVETA